MANTQEETDSNQFIKPQETDFEPSTIHNENLHQNGSATTQENSSHHNTNISYEEEIYGEDSHVIERVRTTVNSVNSKVQHLVEWENTLHSGTALASILAFLIFTAYNSLFNTFCFLALAVIGIDWIYVFATKQFKTLFNQPAANPHDDFIRNPPRISRKSLDPYIDIWVDLLNFGLAEGTKIIFVEDPYRSLKYVGIFYVVWTVASWFSFRSIFGTIVILGFAVPKLYKQNQEVVDRHVTHAHGLVRSHLDRGLEIASARLKPYIEKGKSFAASSGVFQGDNTKKAE
ncbi:hypothetical protein G9A89_006834 [Geosiphon pyriformis]|nr:hypothetical protein G9A89_006834 [Geosiphon pyriformis]